MSVKIMDYLNIIVVIFIINMLFILTTYAGLVIFGFIPSLMTVCKLINSKEIFDSSYKNVFRLYFIELKKSLQDEKKIIFYSTLILLILVADIYIIQQNTLLFSMLFFPTLFLVLLFFLFIFNFTFIVKKNISLTQKVKFSIIFPFTMPSQFFYLTLLIVIFLLIGFVKIESLFFVPSYFLALYFRFLTRQYKKNNYFEEEENEY